MTKVHDIGVLGSGPAALAVTAAFSRRGASVALIAPEPDLPWRPNYCLWADELPPGMASLAEHVWDQASVVTPAGTRQLGRRYLKLDTRALQGFFLDQVNTERVERFPSRATRVESAEGSTRIENDDGSTAHVRVVVDASGAQSRFVRRVHERGPAFQTAFGLTLRSGHHGFDEREMVLMDFRPASHDVGEPPSFAYVLPLAEDRLFIEETSLARRPAVSVDLLRARLETRLASLGLRDAERLNEEHCSIPMGLGLPVRRQSVLPFGAAASMVHPVSGYSIAHALRKADPVASSVLDGLDAGGAEQALADGHASLWPRAHRTAWELYGFGLETLLSMKTEDMGRFFDSFFSMPSEAWSGFLAATLSPVELGGVMTRLFRCLPASLQWHLVRSGAIAGAAPLLRSVLPVLGTA